MPDTYVNALAFTAFGNRMNHLCSIENLKLNSLEAHVTQLVRSLVFDWSKCQSF